MSGEITYVIGHKNPDTDSICSAIALAELKRIEGAENVVAARAGDINPQTSFILDYFKVQPPRYLPNVYPKAADVMTSDVVNVSEETPLLKVMEIMRDELVRFVPVLDPGRRPSGILTLMDLARKYIVRIEAESAREVKTSLKNIIEALGGTVVLDFMGSSELTLSIFVGAMAEESFRAILAREAPRECAIVVGDRYGIQRASIEKGVGLLIVTGGFTLKEDLMDLARKNRVTVLGSPLDSATTALLLRLSTPASSLATPDFETVLPDEPVEEIKFKVAKSNGVVVLDADGVMMGVITKSNLLKPSGTNLVLVDHNELSQAVDGADRVNIIEVVDHHRIGSFHSPAPIPFICEPVGSTSTLVAELFRRKGAGIEKKTAGLLLGGVLSDTVILKSPTTTVRDREAVEWLEEKSGLDHMAFGSEIFAATSSLKKRGPEAAVNGDYKVFEARGRKFGIGQVETIGFEEFYEEKDRLAAELEKVMEKKDLKLSALLVTDIVMGTSLLLAVGDKELIYKLDYPRVEDRVYELRNVLSRKKQVVPHILGVFNSIY